MQAAKPVEIKRHKRYELLDSFRGLVLISMILFHACWDMVYIFDMKWDWYKGAGAYAWQQSICWSFILLSGFCWSLGKRHLRRGLLVFGAGAVISIVTISLMPENRVVFGVLTMLGTCMLLMIPLERWLRKIPSVAGFVIMMLLFACTKNVNTGYLGFEGLNLLKLPDFLYRGSIMTFLGFTDPEFYSTDYFTPIPWSFLFLSGYYIYRMIEKKDFMEKYFSKGYGALSFLGRHSLVIYMVHQPVIYGLLLVLRRFHFF